MGSLLDLTLFSGLLTDLETFADLGKGAGWLLTAGTNQLPEFGVGLQGD